MSGERKRIWCIGIGGSGVSALARLLHARGHAVAGSDLDRSPATDALLDLGIAVTLGQRAANVPEGTDLVIHSAAVAPGHPELEAARARGIPSRKYAQALGALMAERKGIAVAGTHGKTTTTAMTTLALVDGGLDPSMVLGGSIPALGGGCRAGRGEWMVAEACEYDRSFLNLAPRVLVVTNIEADHLDYYKDLGDIRGAFRALAAKVPPEGRIVVCGEDSGALAAVSGLAAPVETYALDPRIPADWSARDLDLAGGSARFTVLFRGEARARIELAVPGRHNALDALAAIAAAHAAGVAPESAAAALERFPGVDRRFQLVGKVGGVSVVDDYAHHPTEIEAVLRAARGRFPAGRVIAVFQPHQHSRTRLLFDGFVDALSGADEVILAEIYRSRDLEADVRAVGAEALAASLRARGASAVRLGGFEEIAARAAAIARPGDVVLTMGAGDIYKVAALLRARLAARGAHLEAA
jgi:UDP-N-acetylmuramate--alanine ligase